MPDTKMPIPPKVVDRLLDLLATDDEFRALFVADRHAALVRAGHELSEEQLRSGSSFACLMVDQLADKEAIAEARDQLRGYLLGAGTHTVVFALDADPVHRVLRAG
ncbi:NHLP-related RiPP peptide [Streptomyces antimicrobicus]|uniref:NHLP-related RiPP peptide n=1 Tax=Streptomyces antimicrobicus TaxID=2883108 RepID=A0ABS8AZZ0_9ACTN|nr:NHLP-related RiPP peptide [Streptomyces antimicrobicus]MCB5177924.1 NHLP-related RiPP peptide [Streptomyces antimicrobicus]